MSHFYGRLNGQAGEATRTGSKNSGISATVRTWSGDLQTRLYSKPDGPDIARIDLRPEHGSSVPLAAFDHGAVLDAIAARDHRTMQAIAAMENASARLDRAAGAHANRKARRP